MPLADDRDRTQQADPNKTRNPYGGSTWNQGGTVLGQWSHGGANSYGWGSNNYASNEAAKAYDLASRTMAAIGAAKNTFALDDPTTGRRELVMRPDNTFTSKADMTDRKNQAQIAAARAKAVGGILRRSYTR